MRFCCNDTGINVSSDMQENEKRIKQLHDIGFRVIGIGGVERATEENIMRMKNLAEKYDMTIGMTPTGYQVSHPDPETRKQHHEGLRKTLVNLNRLGVESMHITGGSYRGDGWWHHPENFTQQGLDDLVEETKKVAPYAEDAGVAICPETTQWCILNSIERMKEYVDRVNSQYIMVTFDVVNHMRPDRIYESGRFFRCAIAILGNRIGMLHVKDVQPVAGLVVHIDEAPMGTGILDHETVISASNDLESWKLFSLEHFNEKEAPIYDQWMQAYKHIMTVSERIENRFTDPRCTRERWKQGLCK